MAKSSEDRPESDDRFGALLTNSAAVRAVVSAVEGTLGPKGLDCMLVDRFGEVVVTNDGVTILERMEAHHPAARMVISMARAQQKEVGDGTTTATLLAGALVAEGVEQVMRGVPVSRVIEGIRFGTTEALAGLDVLSHPVGGLDDPAIERVARVAGRGRSDIAALVVKAAITVGADRLREPGFRLSDAVLSHDGAQSQVLDGIIVERQRLGSQMPVRVSDAHILILDDALEPEKLEEEALATESGFARYLTLREEFAAGLRKILAAGVNVVMTDRGICDLAEEILSDAGVLGVQRVASAELRRVAEHTGARILKRTGLRRGTDELKNCFGHAGLVFEDEKLEHIRILQGTGARAATILIGGATAEVVGERERIARDAADAVQSAIQGGVVPGGGAAEIAAMRRVMAGRNNAGGMAVYGVDCVIGALRRPVAQMATNAGFNSLEKAEAIIAAQESQGNPSLGLDCDTGHPADMAAMGILDPAIVKTHALRAAAELAEAILRINIIIKQREMDPRPGDDYVSHA